jgi:hypothetical protein
MIANNLYGYTTIKGKIPKIGEIGKIKNKIRRT